MTDLAHTSGLFSICHIGKKKEVAEQLADVRWRRVCWLIGALMRAGSISAWPGLSGDEPKVAE